MFIVFEGGEGCGKTTQSKRLYNHFLNQGKKVILTREPGGTKNAEALRHLLVSDQYEDWPIYAEFLLMLAARVDHYEKLIKPYLEQGGIVICDRFMLSTLVYQGYGRGMDVAWMKKIHEDVLKNVMIDKTIVLLLSPQKALGRVQEEQKFEKLGVHFHEQVYKGYQELGKEFDIINVEGKNEDMVFQEILRRF